MKKAIDLYKIGEKLEFNDSRELTNGKRSEGKLTIQPGKKGPPPHIHIQQIEGFEVLNGSMVAIINGKETLLKKGETVIVKAGEAHTFRNGSNSEELVARFWYEPALNMEFMLQTLGESAMENGGDWAKAPILPTMYLLYKAREEYRIAGIPFRLQDVLLGAFAGLAKLTGVHKKISLPEDWK